MQNKEYDLLSRAFYLKSKISHYPVSHSLIPIPEGMSVVFFENNEDCQQYLHEREITDPENFEKIPVRSFYDSIREFAELGYIGVWMYRHFPVRFGNYFSDIDVDLPSFAYTFSGAFIGSSGPIDKPRHFIPWANYSRVDKIIRRFVTFPEGLFFDPQEPVYSVAPANEDHYEEVMSGGKRTFIPCARFPNASPLQGPYISDQGAYCMFSSPEEAQRFLNLQQRGSEEEYVIVEFPTLRSMTKLLEDSHPFVDISLNAASERYLQGYFPAVSDRLILKTVIATFEITPEGKAIEIEPLLDLAKADTIDNPNEIDPAYRSLNTLIDHPLKRFRGATQNPLNKREARSLMEKLFSQEDYREQEQEATIQSIAADSYVFECFDKISGFAFNNVDESAPVILPDIIAAIQFVYHEVFPSDAEVNENGYKLCQSNFSFSGSGDRDREAWILEELRSALRDLAEDILVSGYRIEHSELFKTFVNRNSATLQVQRCGYVGDLAILSDGDAFSIEPADSDESDQESALHRLQKVARAFFHRKKDNFSLDPKILNRIQIYLGESYENISSSSLVILVSAIKQLGTVADREHHDYAGISMKLCKVFERELTGLIFDHAAKYIKEKFSNSTLKALLKDAESRNDMTEVKLLKWLLKQGKIELGPMAFVIKRITESCNTEPLKSFREAVLELDNCQFLLSDDFQDICKLISTKYRNGGVHEKIITYEICREAFHCILEMPDSYLSRLASVTASKLPNCANSETEGIATSDQ